MTTFYKTQKIIEDSCKDLSQSGSLSPRLDAELLLCHVLLCSRIDLLKKSFEKIDESKVIAFQKLLQRRLNHEPMAHILGQQEFYGYLFKVTKDTLIPRPETELLVEAAAKYLSGFSKAPKVLDLGTGTGCISIVLSLLNPKASITAIDIHEATLKVAEENALKLGATHIKFWQADVLQKKFWQDHEAYDLIISNPPYISASEESQMSLEVLKHEPKRALFADSQGLKFYEVYARYGRNLLKKNGLMFLELSPFIYDKVCQIFLEESWEIKKTIHDLAGHKRHLVVQIKNS